jgi:hypothetical protein
MSLNTELKRKEQEIENEGRDEYKRKYPVAGHM